MDEPKLKVGDELAFFQWGRCVIYPIDKITPSGMIKCGHYELDPNLRVRGRNRSAGTPYCAERVTDEIRQACLRDSLLDKITSLYIAGWSELSTETLEKIVALMEAKP